MARSGGNGAPATILFPMICSPDHFFDLMPVQGRPNAADRLQAGPLARRNLAYANV